MELIVGIDPSINSTGLYYCVYDDEKKIEEKFCIIKPNKLSKQELISESIYGNIFSYFTYDKLDYSTPDNHINELNKTKNFISIMTIIKDIILDAWKKYNKIPYIKICQEGISYGSSIRTKSIYDLAGLNFILRQMIYSNIIKYTNQAELLVCSPSEIKKFAVGKGNASKDIIIECFKQVFPELNIPKIDDIADAFFIAQFAKQYQSELI